MRAIYVSMHICSIPVGVRMSTNHLSAHNLVASIDRAQNQHTGSELSVFDLISNCHLCWFVWGELLGPIALLSPQSNYNPKMVIAQTSSPTLLSPRPVGRKWSKVKFYTDGHDLVPFPGHLGHI